MRGGKLYGRGSCDMKAGLTANVYAVQILQLIGFIPADDVLLESVIGERAGAPEFSPPSLRASKQMQP